MNEREYVAERFEEHRTHLPSGTWRGSCGPHSWMGGSAS